MHTITWLTVFMHAFCHTHVENLLKWSIHVLYIYILYIYTIIYTIYTSCHLYYSKKSILYSQALRFNRTCSKNQFFDKRCNDLEVWLKNCGYNEKLVRQQILKTRKYRRTELLYSQRKEVHKNKLKFNITYYPFFSKLKNVLSKIYRDNG